MIKALSFRFDIVKVANILIKRKEEKEIDRRLSISIYLINYYKTRLNQTEYGLFFFLQRKKQKKVIVIIKQLALETTTGT